MKLSNLVLSIPHSSTVIPGEIRKQIPHDDNLLWRESDLFTDRIYYLDDVRVVKAEYSQIIADVNRAPDEIYTEGSNRTLGVVKISLSEGKDTFRKDPSIEEMAEWVQQYHRPFHRALFAELKKPETRFLIDCHSMWSRAARFHLDSGEERADIVLGNREYSSCSAEVTQFFRDYFLSLGYTVKINEPFYGRYIVGTYCSRLGTRGMQIEINRSLYMDEDTLKPDDAAISRLHREFSNGLKLFCEWDEEHGSDRHMIDLSMLLDEH